MIFWKLPCFKGTSSYASLLLPSPCAANAHSIAGCCQYMISAITLISPPPANLPPRQKKYHSMLQAYGVLFVLYAVLTSKNNQVHPSLLLELQGRPSVRGLISGAGSSRAVPQKYKIRAADCEQVGTPRTRGQTRGIIRSTTRLSSDVKQYVPQ